MKVLAIDSTAGIAAVALTDGEKILADYTINSGNTHSTTLLPMTESILKVLGLTVSDVDLFVLSAGPGSFTGVRIGAATIKGLAFAENKPCVAVSTLEAMAENFKDVSGIVCPVINARRSQLYCALFRCGGGKTERLTPDDTLASEELAGMLTAYKDEPIYFTGDGYDIIDRIFDGANKKTTPAALRDVRAVGAAWLGERIYFSANAEERAAMNSESLSPIYLKKPQAEREREEKIAAQAAEQ